MKAAAKLLSTTHLSRLVPLPRLTTTMVAMVLGTSFVAAEEAAAPPAPEPAPSPAQALLDEWSSDEELLRAGRESIAENHFREGMAARESGKLTDALEHLKLAVDYQPQNERYRKALAQTENLAGVGRETRSEHIDNLVQQLEAQTAVLWAEITQRIEEGQNALVEGDYNVAELAFQQAELRLDTLPYQHPGQAAKKREVQKFLAITQQRRKEDDLKRYQNQLQDAQDEKQELTKVRLQLEQDRINNLLQRAQKARERRDYDRCILLCEQVLRTNRTNKIANSLIVTARRERHAYLRQITADLWEEEHQVLWEQIRSTMLPQLDIIVYPDDWAQIDAMRSAPSHNLGADDLVWKEEIDRNLEQVVTFDFRELDIQDIIDYLQRNTPVNFILDPQVVIDGSVPPITLQLTDVKLRHALDFLMRQTGLRYRLQGEAVYVSNSAGLRGDALMKIYDVRDLMIGLTDFPGPSMDIPDAGGDGVVIVPEIADDKAPDISEFIDIITEVIEPESWGEEGVGIQEWNGSLIVTQTSKVHTEIESLLRTLRNQQAVQINVKVRFLAVENASLEEIGVDWNNFTGPAGWPAPDFAGGLPTNPGVSPPWWLGGYWNDNPGGGTQNIVGGTVTNTLSDYFSDSGLTPDGGLGFEFQIFEDPEGFLGRAVLKAVEKTRRTNAVIQPDLTLMSGQRAHITRMSAQSYIGDYNVTGQQFQPEVNVLNYGTVLDVQAIASADRKWITMTLRPVTTEVEQWRRFGNSVGNFGGIQTINVQDDGGNVGGLADNFPVTIPQIRYRSVSTSVTIPDGGSLLIGGMTETQESRAHSGVPFLSHIPFLGRLFSKNGNSKNEFKDLIYVSGNIILFQEVEAEL